MDKKVTISDIARDAGVSLATVSRVLNQKGAVRESTGSRVLASAQKLGYEMPTESEPRSAEGGLLLFCVPSIGNHFYNEVFDGAQTSAQRLGYQFLLYEGHINRSTLPALQSLIRHTHAQGVVTVNHIAAEVLVKLESLVPVIQCCEFNEALDRSYVSIDDVKASSDAVEYLYSLGRRKIAFLNGPGQYKYARHRMQGYLRGLEKVGLPFDERLVVNLPDVRSQVAISAAMQLINSDDRPDAFFTASDVFACAVIRAAYLAGFRVPGDLLVVGFDNIDITSTSVPSITTVNQPKLQLGFSACEILIEKIQNPSVPPKKVILETEMIIRESTLV